jgi:hypothetical protein
VWNQVNLASAYEPQQASESRRVAQVARVQNGDGDPRRFKFGGERVASDHFQTGDVEFKTARVKALRKDRDEPFRPAHRQRVDQPKHAGPVRRAYS